MSTTTAVLPQQIFNLDKTDYENPSIFFGQAPGLFDTIHKKYPKLWGHYKNLRSLDWDENEFDYSTCNDEFKRCDPTTYDMMIKTLAWQWETDSIAARILIRIMGAVCTSSEAWAGYSQISANEVVHAATYSEIVRGSFDFPEEVLGKILEVKEAQSRLVKVSEVFDTANRIADEYALGRIPADQYAYNAIFMFVIAMLFLERVQFLPSFAVTFAIAEDGKFLPIGKAVQKIAQDEFEVHVQFGMDVLRYELTTERGQRAMAECRPKIIQLLNEIVASEDNWINYAFSEGRRLRLVSKNGMLNFNRFNGTKAAEFLGIQDEVDFPLVTELPLAYMKGWMNISMIQSSPQEEDNNQYKVGLVNRDDDGEIDEYQLVL